MFETYKQNLITSFTSCNVASCIVGISKSSELTKENTLKDLSFCLSVFLSIFCLFVCLSVSLFVCVCSNMNKNINKKSNSDKEIDLMHFGTQNSVFHRQE